MNEKALLVSFKLFLNDKIESERTLISVVNRHISGEDLINDPDIEESVERMCEKNGISFRLVKKHAKEMYND